MTDSIESQLRAHLKRKLKHVHGKGQITVRRLVKSIYPKQGNSFNYEEEPSLDGRHALYSLAAEICEKEGGKLDACAYNRCKGHGSVASRVYQF